MSGNKIVCPYCFEVFKRQEVWYRCDSHTCKDEEDKPMGKFWNEVVKDKRAFKPSASLFSSMLGKMPVSGICPECQHESTKAICPHCHNQLPREMVENGGVIISIIGARSSGKTNYITTLINELKNKGYKLNLSLMARDVGRNKNEHTTARYEMDFFNTLYVKNVCHAGTKRNDSRSKIPLIYKLSNNKAKEHLYLVFYDTAGENFTEIDAIKANAKFLENSAGIIFLLDTFTIPYVHQQLKRRFPELDDIEIPYNRLIDSLTNYFDGEINKNKFYKKPIAMTFSKIDSILMHSDILGTSNIPGLKTSTNSSFLYTSKLSLNDIDTVGEGLEAALGQCWGENQFLETNKCFQNLHYFGISALGNMPENKVEVKDIRPYRVMDPLVWILNQLKFPLPMEK